MKHVIAMLALAVCGMGCQTSTENSLPGTQDQRVAALTGVPSSPPLISQSPVAAVPQPIQRMGGPLPPPMPGMVEPLPAPLPALTAAKSEDQTIDQLLDQMEALREQKAELEKKEKAILKALQKKTDKIKDRMDKLDIEITDAKAARAVPMPVFSN